MADLINVTFNDLLGKNFSEKDYAVSSNWRIRNLSPSLAETLAWRSI